MAPVRTMDDDITMYFIYTKKENTKKKKTNLTKDTLLFKIVLQPDVKLSKRLMSFEVIELMFTCTVVTNGNVLLLNKNVSHGFDGFSPIICSVSCHISTCVISTRRTKTDSGITTVAVMLIVGKDTNSCLGIIRRREYIEPLLVAVALQRGLGTNQLLPSIATQWGAAILSISDQWV